MAGGGPMCTRFVARGGRGGSSRPGGDRMRSHRRLKWRGRSREGDGSARIASALRVRRCASDRGRSERGRHGVAGPAWIGDVEPGGRWCDAVAGHRAACAGRKCACGRGCGERGSGGGVSWRGYPVMRTGRPVLGPGHAMLWRRPGPLRVRAEGACAVRVVGRCSEVSRANDFGSPARARVVRGSRDAGGRTPLAHSGRNVMSETGCDGHNGPAPIVAPPVAMAVADPDGFPPPVAIVGEPGADARAQAERQQRTRII